MVLNGEVTVSIEGIGNLVQGEQVLLGQFGGAMLCRQVKVFSRDAEGNLTEHPFYNGIQSNLDDQLESGEWFVVFGIEWRDGYVSEEYYYERHYDEYVIKLIVNE